MSVEIARRVIERDRLVAALPKSLLDSEVSVVPFRWFGYSFMSAVDCTRQFANDYGDVYYYKYGIRTDIWREPEDPEFRTLWRMRQAADDIGVPYADYLEISFLGARRDPYRYNKPHLYFAEMQKPPRSRRWGNALKLKYDNMHSWYPRLASMPEYWMENFAGLPSQIGVRERFRAKMANLSDAVGHIAMHAILNKNLSLREMFSPYDENEKRYIQAELKFQVKIGLITSSSVQKLDSDEIVETCFGWRGTRHVSSHCQSCPLSAACVEVSQGRP